MFFLALFVLDVIIDIPIYIEKFSFESLKTFYLYVITIRINLNYFQINLIESTKSDS